MNYLYISKYIYYKKPYATPRHFNADQEYITTYVLYGLQAYIMFRSELFSQSDVRVD